MKGLLIKLGITIAVGGFCLYSYLNQQNRLTHLKIQLPEVESEVKQIREDTRRLAYQINQFESPSHLIDLARRPEYSHLKHPLLKEIFTVPEEIALNEK